MDGFIPLSIPNIQGNELKYVTEAMSSGWVSTAGSYVNRFEQTVADYVHAAGAVSCQNGTAGLHIAMLLCGVHPGDEVIVPALTFIAAVNPVKYAFAEPVFMDCDDSLCMNPEKLLDFCKNGCEIRNGSLTNRKTGRVVRAVVVVHVFGNLADMERILDIAEKYGLKVIEDATEALGTYGIRGKCAGRFAGTMGDVGVYSFNGNKIITTGGGGMIVSDNGEWLRRAKHLTTQAKSDEVNYFHDEIGYNYRMTNIQAAMGVGQMEKLEEFIRIKNKNYALYEELVESIPHLRLLPFRPDIRSNKWFYALYLEDGYKMGVFELIEYLSQKRIQARPIWGLIHEQPPYKGAQAWRIERAAEYYRRVVNIPCSTCLTEEEVRRVAGCL